MKELKDELDMGICPICGKRVIADKYHLMWLEGHKMWHFAHYCYHNGEDKMHTASIFITGKTQEEVIKRWNASQNRKDD